jgi:hypothetical protein
VFVHGKPLIPRLMFWGKARGLSGAHSIAGKTGTYPSEAAFRCSTLG